MGKYFLGVILILSLFLIAYNMIPQSEKVISDQPEPKVRIIQSEGKFQLLRNGEPYFIKGAGTFLNLRQVKEYGGNSIRVWDTSDATRILDEAHELGLTVNLGIWITRQKEGFSFYNNKMIDDELRRIRSIVLRYKDHPALLMWTIGNEMSAGNPGIRMWDSLNKMANLVKELDPDHPVTTTIFNVGLGSLRAINKRCPSIDIASFNTYGSLISVKDELQRSLWRGPFVISEFGAKGYWESHMTSWKEPFEQTSSEKAAFIKERYLATISEHESCLGGYIFFWGNKTEKTHTWYSLFSANGEKTEIVDIMQYLWTNTWPENRAPGIDPIMTDGYQLYESMILKAGSVNISSVTAFDPENDPLSYHWEVLPELDITDGSIEKQKKPRSIRGSILSEQKDTIQWKAPEKPGAYRLFVTVSDGNNNIATANVPLMVSSGPEIKPIKIWSRFFNRLPLQ
jgi:hypothetical protein